MADDVTRLPLNRVRLGFIAGGCFLPVLILLPFVLALGFELSSEMLGLWGLIAVFAALSFYIAGIALFTPHGLRLDAHGMSGYYSPAPFKWSDIAEIELVTSNKNKLIGLRLHDRDAYWDALTPRQRLFRLGQPAPFHASIPLAPFQATETELLALLRRYWRRYR